MSPDLSFSLFVHERLMHPLVTSFNIALTRLGSIGFIWILTAIICLIYKPTRIVGISILFALALSLGLSNLIKYVVDRPRPYEAYAIKLLIAPPHGSSFPSAHTASSVAAVTVYCKMIDKKPGTYFKWPLIILAALTAFSRIYLFVHYASDILGGIVVGVLSGALIVYMARRLEKRLEK